MPGPWVVESTVWPTMMGFLLLASTMACLTASETESTFPTTSSSEKSHLAMVRATQLFFCLNGCRARLLVMYDDTSSTTVPLFGVGINPFGPSFLAMALKDGTISGVLTARSNTDRSSSPEAIFSTRSFPPATLAPEARAASCMAGSDAKTRIWESVIGRVRRMLP